MIRPSTAITITDHRGCPPIAIKCTTAITLAIAMPGIDPQKLHESRTLHERQRTGAGAADRFTGSKRCTGHEP